jgi:hypothetical protein
MSDKVDEANHDAKLDANGAKGLGGAKQEIEKLDPTKPKAGEQGKVPQCKEDCDDELDGAIEDINAGRIQAADRKIRHVKKRLRALWPEASLGGVFAKLDHAAEKKLGITQPAVKDVSYDLRELVLALLAEAFGEALRDGALVLPPLEPARGNGEGSESGKRRARAAARG